MIQRGTEEPIDFPCPNWTDEDGKVWSNPTWEFMGRRGFVQVVAPPHVPTAEEIAAGKKRLIAAISNAAREAVESQANAALQDQMYANYKSATPHPMIVAVINWGKSIYLEAEMRKAQVQAGVADDVLALCDFSSFGEKPYTVYHLYLQGLVEL
jgi:hypothetical protein